MTVHKWRDVSARVRERPGADERLETLKSDARREIHALGELRRARQFTQVRLAEALGKPQSHVSRIENQADLYLSTLRSYVEAMGGRLEVLARFSDAEIPIGMFADIDEHAGDESLTVATGVSA
jgi:hypothetical protein